MANELTIFYLSDHALAGDDELVNVGWWRFNNDLPNGPFSSEQEARDDEERKSS